MDYVKRGNGGRLIKAVTSLATKGSGRGKGMVDGAMKVVKNFLFLFQRGVKNNICFVMI